MSKHWTDFIKHLSIDEDYTITNDYFSDLHNLQELEALSVYSEADVLITSKVADTLATLTKLTSIDISNSSVSDDFF